MTPPDFLTDFGGCGLPERGDMELLWRYLIIGVLAYLIGSLSTAVLLTRGDRGGDVRSHGSGNAGATNVARVFGLKRGLLTLGGDMAKMAVAGLIGSLIAGRNGLAVACMCCFIGHCWPVWFGFKGGKGISVAGCAALLFDWRMFVAIALVFLAAAFLSKRVSVGSLTAALVYPLAYYLPTRDTGPCLWVCIIIAILVFYLHRTNIVRLVHGEEPEFKPRSK